MFEENKAASGKIGSARPFNMDLSLMDLGEDFYDCSAGSLGLTDVSIRGRCAKSDSAEWNPSG
jgi:hypothetical protein